GDRNGIEVGDGRGAERWMTDARMRLEPLQVAAGGPIDAHGPDVTLVEARSDPPDREHGDRRDQQEAHRRSGSFVYSPLAVRARRTFPIDWRSERTPPRDEALIQDLRQADGAAARRFVLRRFGCSPSCSKVKSSARRDGVLSERAPSTLEETIS